MQYLGIEYQMNHAPKLDPTFIPFGVWREAYLKGAKLISYGPEAVIAYLAAVEGEITAVRMILTGRLAGIAPQVIRERLRDLYA